MSAGEKRPAAANDGPRKYWGAPLHEWCTAAGLGHLNRDPLKAIGKLLGPNLEGDKHLVGVVPVGVGHF